MALPLNLRNKSEQLDERMAGFTRSQVVAEEHGLLFTRYRGTVDGTPDGEPYAFVHTLDFADGVWCLDVDPLLELDRVPGSLAVGGDRLYVASANGKVGSFPIPSITDPTRSPDMEWVVDAVAPGDEAPLITADDETVYVTDPARPGSVAHVHGRASRTLLCARSGRNRLRSTGTNSGCRRSASTERPLVTSIAPTGSARSKSSASTAELLSRVRTTVPGWWA